jgi:5-methylcytosine-specific restriction enzyme A
MFKPKYIIYRYLTSADWFNIYKPSGTEVGGGGQSYIDFPTNDIPMEQWGEFFDGADNVYCDSGTQGPIWTFPVISIGERTEQDIKIYQRRQQTVCIASQKITSRGENRINAWRPDNGFPEPSDPKERSSVPKNLMIYLVRCEDNSFFAGWTNAELLTGAGDLLGDIVGKNRHEGYASFYKFPKGINLNPNDRLHPLSS